MVPTTLSALLVSAPRTVWRSVLVVLPIFVMLAGDAFAQAGGGGSYSGGGGGGSGGGGGDGLGWVIYGLFRLILHSPAIGIPVTIVVLGAVAYGGRNSVRGHHSRVIGKARSSRQKMTAQQSEAALQKVDPAFDAMRFLTRVRGAFVKAQESWQAQDLAPLRPFVSDGIYERFSLQIADQKRQGWRQQIDDLHPGNFEIKHVASDQHFDTVTVRVPFSAVIYRVDLKTGDKIRGSNLPRQSFAEAWSFLRRRGAKSSPKDGLMEGHCPNCAAPLEISASAKCSSCETRVLSPEYDWVLAEITQECEWQAEGGREVPGLRQLQEQDPDLNVQHLEDKVSVAFWRKVGADQEGRADPLRKVAHPEFLKTYAQSLRPSQDGRRLFMGDCAVGSVKTLAFMPGKEWDRALVEVRYDGVRWAEQQGRAEPIGTNRSLRRDLFVLGRQPGAKSDLGRALSGAGCPTCGGPDSDEAADACPWCGAVVNTGAKDWVVREIELSTSPQGRALLAEVREGIGPEPVTPAGALQWTVQMAVADGELNPKERAAMQSLAARCGVPGERVEELLRAAENGSDLPPPNRDPAFARQVLAAMVDLALADGRLTRPEERLLFSAGERLGTPQKGVRLLINQARTQLYKSSKAALRQEKEQRKAG